MLIAALILAVSVLQQPVCTIGSAPSSWSGSPADIAAIEAVYQREAAEQNRRPFPTGAPERSPWSSLVTCRT